MSGHSGRKRRLLRKPDTMPVAEVGATVSNVTGAGVTSVYITYRHMNANSRTMPSVQSIAAT